MVSQQVILSSAL